MTSSLQEKDAARRVDAEEIAELGREDLSAAIRNYLAVPLQDYFRLAEQEPLTPRLASLVTRFEAALAAQGRAVAAGFRDDLIKALPALRTFALSLCGNVSRVDDLVQETMIKAWANQERFRPGTNFTAWVFTILRNQFYTEMRRAKREVEDADGAHAGRLTAPADQEDASTLRAVWEKIAALPQSQQQALILVGAEGCTYEEAAARLGCQVGTVKSRVSRARASLAGALADGADGLRPVPA
ncbi:sigma-70 family RNA polymerase sigma factor [Methylobacterium durans]|uniref:sigma-70 family RNA polymerase sigma factor n=1 Tax=Methylobacterium durans TaxID=2202825 RepID=UPI003C6D6EC6